MKSIVALAMTLLLLPAVVVGQRTVPSDDALQNLDAVIEAYMEQNNIPGAQVAVASRGRILELRNYGMANVELKVPVSPDTVFEIGSISKQFVTAAVMVLHEQGDIGLDDGIHRYLPYLPSEWVDVTVRQLMTHTSGIPDYEEIRTYDVYRYRLTPEEVIRIGHSRPMDFAPGTGYYYSNTGYFLLSMIVERIEGKPLGQVLEERIFGPLGMTQTRMSQPGIHHTESGGRLLGRSQRCADQSHADGNLIDAGRRRIAVFRPGSRNLGRSALWHRIPQCGIQSRYVAVGHPAERRRYGVRLRLAGDALPRNGVTKVMVGQVAGFRRPVCALS